MLAPLYQLGHISDAGMIISALIVGFVFGYFLERTGLSDARKITAVFYFEDMRILRVMFSAAVTALILNFFAYYLGFIDINLVKVVDFNAGGLIAGGIVVGFGVILGGYCPGTSLVAAATRKIDGLIFVIGMFIGMFIYNELFSFFSFFRSRDSESVTLSGVTGIPYGILVFIITVIAVTGFYSFRFFEGKVYKKS